MEQAYLCTTFPKFKQMLDERNIKYTTEVDGCMRSFVFKNNLRMTIKVTFWPSDDTLSDIKINYGSFSSTTRVCGESCFGVDFDDNDNVSFWPDTEAYMEKRVESEINLGRLLVN